MEKLLLFHPNLLQVFKEACLEVSLAKSPARASTLCLGTEREAMPKPGQIRAAWV